MPNGTSNLSPGEGLIIDFINSKPEIRQALQEFVGKRIPIGGPLSSQFWTRGDQISGTLDLVAETGTDIQNFFKGLFESKPESSVKPQLLGPLERRQAKRKTLGSAIGASTGFPGNAAETRRDLFGGRFRAR